jgi:UDP-glucose 4-epimerase
MKLLLTGATGFLGSALLPLLASRADVFALHRPGTDPAPAHGVSWIAQDLTHPLTDALPDRIDAVLHLAQSRRYRDLPDGAPDVIAVNVLATTRLLDYCRRAGGSTFAFASSGAVAGPGPAPRTEDDRCQPGDLYGLSKAAAEQVVEHYRSHFRAHALRYFFIYGPGQRGMLVPRICDQIARGRPVVLAGPDGTSINPVYIEDAALATLAALELDASATVNIAGPETITLRELAGILGQALAREPQFVHRAPQPDLVGSIERMTDLLITPCTPPREGLLRTLTADGAQRDATHPLVTGGRHP